MGATMARRRPNAKAAQAKIAAAKKADVEKTSKANAAYDSKKHKKSKG